MRPSKPLSILLSLALALFFLSVAIAVPILCRPFYYRQIDALDLPEATGWSEQTIRGAYDEVMDYLVCGAPFGTGELRWSESGQAHFADCRTLFRLDFVLLGVSAAVLAVLVPPRANRLPSLLRPQPRLLGGSRAERGVPARRPLGCDRLHQPVHRLPPYVLPRQDQLGVRLAHG